MTGRGSSGNRHAGERKEPLFFSNIGFLMITHKTNAHPNSLGGTLITKALLRRREIEILNPETLEAFLSTRYDSATTKISLINAYDLL